MHVIIKRDNNVLQIQLLSCISRNEDVLFPDLARSKNDIMPRNYNFTIHQFQLKHAILAEKILAPPKF